MSKVYLDYNATTPVRPTVATAYNDALTLIGNPSSHHHYGQTSKAALEHSRLAISKSIGSQSTAIIFTSSGSEGNNQVLQSVWRQSLRQNEPIHIITSAIEHSSIRVTLDYLSQFGVKVTSLPVSNTGHVSAKSVQAALTPDTKLISIILANNEVGTIQPLADICEIAHHHNCLVHTDAVQAFGKMPISVRDIPVDFMTLSAHKVYAPKGSGALYVKADQTLDALIYGGGHERALRAGTENLPGIIAFGCAASELSGGGEWQRQQTLLDKIVRELRSEISSIVVHSDHNYGLPNTLSLGIEGLDGHALAINLDLAGIAVSTGSACSTGSIDPSPVLDAMGVSPSLNLGSIRVSVGAQTTIDDIDYFVTQYIQSVRQMQSG